MSIKLPSEKYQKQIIELVAATGMSPVAVIAAKRLYDSFFKRHERPDYAITPGLFNYELLKSELPRENMVVHSHGVELSCYYYKADRPRGIVVVVHGIHAGADDYLPVIEYFVKHNYNVFAFDWAGTFDSGGDSVVGMCQALVDLDRVINFIKSFSYFFGLPKFLWGHSCGGYAVTSILSKYSGFGGCACVSAVNDCYKIILQKGRQYGGDLAAEGMPKVFLDAYQKILFGEYTELNGTIGINSTETPVFVAHGIDDKVISFDSQSIMSHKHEIHNPNVRYYVGTGKTGGHTSILYSERSADYRAEVDKAAENIKRYEDKVEFYKGVDHRLYSEVNTDLMDKIIAMFNMFIGEI